MDYSPKVTADSLLDVAAFLVRDIDRIERYAAQVQTLPKMHANYMGQIDGQRTALAYLAGSFGHGTVAELIERVRRERPTVTGGDRRDPANPPPMSPVAIAQARVQAAMAGAPIPDWPADHADGE